MLLLDQGDIAVTCIVLIFHTSICTQYSVSSVTGSLPKRLFDPLMGIPK